MTTTTNSPQCRAKCKESQQRCKLRAMSGGLVCHKHGGKASQVMRKAAQRITQAELMAQAKADPGLGDATPAQMLLHAANATGRVMLMLQERGAEAPLDPAYLDTFGVWIDRTSKSYQVVVASKADELVIAQQVHIAEGQARQLAVVMNQVLNALGLTPDQHALVPAALGSALAALGLIPKPSASVQVASSGEGSLAIASAIGGSHV